jgi:HEAT repeat protein
VNNGFDIAWLLVGLFGSLSLVAVFLTVTEQWFRSRKLGNRAQTYETVFVAVEGLLEIQARPGPATDYLSESEIHAKNLSAMLGSQSTVGDAVEALADAARARPQIATVLRGRDGAVKSITAWVDEQLASEDNYKRAHAVEVIASLRMRSCRGALAAATSDADPIVRAAACRALAAIDPSAAIGSLLRIVETDGKWAADLLADLLARRESKVPADVGAGPRGTEEPDQAPLGGERDAINARLQDWAATPALLRLADGSMPASAKRALASALEADDPEMRLRAVSLLRSQSVEDASRGLERLVNDEVEAVRIAAIQALAQFRRDEHIMILAALVGDSSRMVRFTAAEALRLTKGGEALLRALAKSSDGSTAEAASLALWQVNEAAVAAAAAENGPPEIEVVPFVRQSDIDAVFKELKSSLELGFHSTDADEGK